MSALISDQAAPSRPEQPFQCAVSADLFWRAFQATADNASRIILTGVHVEPCDEGGAVMTGCDGNILIAIRDPDGLVMGKGIVRPNALMMAAAKAQKSDPKTQERVLMVRQDAVTQPVAMIALAPCVGPDTTRDNIFDLIDNPDYRVSAVQYDDVTINADYHVFGGIMPPDDRYGLSGVAINATALKPIIAAFKPYKGKETQLAMFTRERDPDTSPILIKPEAFPLQNGAHRFDAFAIIQPAKSEGPTAGLPDWGCATFQTGEP